MTYEEFIKERNAYAHAKYDIIEDFELKLFDCFNDLAPLPDNKLEYTFFDYFSYDDEYDACTEVLPDDTRYRIILPGYVVEKWFEGKTDDAKKLLAKNQKTTDRYKLKKD
jgi:hypothetical protein